MGNLIHLSPRYPYSFKTPGKINHYLKILDKLPSGKHNLILDYFPISLADEINIFPEPRNKLVIINSAVKKQSNDLLYKTIVHVEKFCNVKISMFLKVNKNIPSGSGLGGGSSNAGCLLVALNRIFSLGINDDDLFNIAEKVGSDVPFFLHRRPGIYQHGESEQLKRFNHAPKKILLVFPDFKTSTESAFKTVAPHIKPGEIDYFAFDYKHWFSHKVNVNDFWNKHHPQFKKLNSIRESLIDIGFDSVFLTGTGSTLYAMSEDDEQNYKAFNLLRTIPGITAIRSQTMNGFPLTIN